MLSSALTSQQAYDVTIFLHLPRTTNNLGAGNFMIDLALLAPSKSSSLEAIPSSLSGFNSSASTLARSRRPAILTQNSEIVSTASTFVALPWYVLGWKKESEVLQVSMFEGVEFTKGSANVPDKLKVILEADQKMQFYEAGVRIVARFGGLRWLLYHHRILSFILFTTTFWSSSMLSMLMVWFGLSMYMSSSATPPPVPEKDAPDKNGLAVKNEPTEEEIFDPTSFEDLSDTPRSFPTLGRQGPLHFVGRKKEEEEEKKIKKEVGELDRMTNIPPIMGTEADDEADSEAREGSEWRDSGIGTSREDERREDMRRRRKAFMGSGTG